VINSGLLRDATFCGRLFFIVFVFVNVSRILRFDCVKFIKTV